MTCIFGALLFSASEAIGSIFTALTILLQFSCVVGLAVCPD